MTDGMKERVAAIVGPTAAGKSAIAVEVAERLGAEIVSIDSMQIYRGMDVGTDKATPEMRERVPHHLLDVRDPSDDVSVAEFQDMARAAIDDIVGRGNLPLLVGGSGLYFRAVIDELDFPPTVPEVRSRLEEEAERLGPQGLHEILKELDPAAAERIEPSNARRTIRALEVIEVTGRLFSDNDSWGRYESIYDLRVAGLQRDRAELDERIGRRARSMLAQGLVQEVISLNKQGMGKTARMALGYRQILNAAGASSQEIEDAIATATRRFARRQESWFRADPRTVWFYATSEDLVEELTSYLGAREDPV